MHERQLTVGRAFEVSGGGGGQGWEVRGGGGGVGWCQPNANPNSPAAARDTDARHTLTLTPLWWPGTLTHVTRWWMGASEAPSSSELRSTRSTRGGWLPAARARADGAGPSQWMPSPTCWRRWRATPLTTIGSRAVSGRNPNPHPRARAHPPQPYLGTCAEFGYDVVLLLPEDHPRGSPLHGTAIRREFKKKQKVSTPQP